MRKLILFLSVILLCGTLSAQDRDPVEFKRQQDEKLLQLAQETRLRMEAEKAEAIRVAHEKGWIIRAELDDGSLMEIVRINKNGIPEYDITNNLNAARTSETDHLWSGGGAGLALSGAGMLIGEWDGGGVLTTHQEFNNGSGTRVTQRDSPASTHYHSTHVAGTIIAEGEDNNAHGMAWEANLDTYDWDSDMAEMATAAASDDLILSNHSYGRNRGWNYADGNWYWWGDVTISTTEDYQFGFYGDLAHDWDEIAHNAPHYLICKAAGNDRDDDHSGGHYYLDGLDWTWSTAARDEDGGADGYDCIGNRGVAKNILTVGAVWDIPDGYSIPGQVIMEVYSGWGPTDDGRIKPDIVANGRNLYSSTNTGNSNYLTISGTSMATPTVTGTLALIQEHYDNLRGGYMNAAVLKGLALNTAHEAGTADGPDYQFGWGLLNATGMAQLVTDDNDEGGLIVEAILENGETDDYTYYCDGSTDINVTICWNDPPHAALTPALNPTTKVIVNDLNLRILDESSAVFMPWVLNPLSPANAATKGHNSRDNVETINIQNPEEGFYTVRIHHSGSLSGDQTYALIINGMTTPPEDNYCETRHTSWGYYEYIKNVSFGSIDNNTGRSPGGYADFTGFVSELTAGDSETLDVTIQGYSGDEGKAWVDWNQDGDFDDAGEAFDLGTGPGPYSTSITAPVDAANGYTTMRVCLSFNQTPDACGNFTYGETEDYTIKVINPVNYWTGAFNSYWHNAGNWSLGHIPTATEDVIMTSAGNHPPSVAFYNEACKNLTIELGAGLIIAEKTLTVNGNLTIYGNLAMNNSAGVLSVMGDVVWKSGSTAGFTASTAFNVYGNWTFESGANANIGAGTVLFLGASNKYIRNYSATSSFFNVGSYKPANYELGISNWSTQPLAINGYIYVHPAAQFGVYSTSDLVLKGNINSNGIFLCNYGTLKLDGASQELRMNVDNYFNNLTFSQTGTVTVNNSLSSIVDVNGNVLIESGVFNLSNRTMKVGGNWTNTAGSSAFTEGTSRVIFDGTGHNYVKTSETFNILEANMGAALRVDNAASVVTCNQYDWTSGGIDVIAGTFTALDLVDNGIYGGYWLNPGGTINLTNDAWVDLDGNLNIYGGNFNVYGGITNSYWPYSANASITMSGGVLDFKGVGIYIPSTSSYTFTENISGGVIRTVGDFNNQRVDFTPTGNTIELYGTTDAYLTTGVGCGVDDVVVNKGATDNTPPTPLFDREGKPIEQTRGSTVFAGDSPLTILGNLTLDAGIFGLNTYTVNVTGNVAINGATLKMTSPTDKLTANYISWNAGSNDDVTSGEFHSNIWSFNDGTNAQFGIGNTAYLQDMYFPTDADAEFGNLVVEPLSKTVSNDGKAYYPVRVAGNFTMQSGATWGNMAYGLIVMGNANIQSGGSLAFPTDADMLCNGSLTLAGSLYLDTGSEATVNGDFVFPNTGTLSAGAGTFTNNYSTGVASLAGTLELTSGVVEFPNRSVLISGTFNDLISGGTFRVGKTFAATAANSFQPTAGTMEFINASSGNYVQVNNGNYLFDMVLDKPGSSFQVYDDLTIKGSLSIDDGTLNSANKTISIAGNWMNNVGPAAFDETTGRIIFNGIAAQNCSSEEFHILEVNKPTELLYNVSEASITCQIYDWTSGGLWITSGDFSAADLADAGLFGTFAIFNGTMDLYQDIDQWVDLNGDITIGPGGHLNVYGGNGDSWWPFAGNASITMSAGVLDFKDVGIFITSNAYILTENITGGTIRTSGNFQAENPVFTPAGGTVELYGGINAAISNSAGANFHNLTIDKSGGSDEGSGPLITRDRNGETIVLSRANQVLMYSDLLVNGNLTVDAGNLDMGIAGNSLTCMGSASIENGATLEMFASSKLKLNTSLTVKNGGTLQSTGSAGYESWITRAATNRYLFNVQSGGNIGASNTIFEYMGANGIRIASGAVVDPAQAFNNCTFQQGLSANTLLTINSTQTLECTGAIFPANTWGGTNNVKKSVNSGRITFYDYSGAFAGSAYESDPYSRVDWFTPELSASPLTLNVNPPAGTATINITSNLAWTATESSPWFSISPLSGINNGNITVTYNQNTLASSRSGIITISAPDVPDVTVTVVQAGATLTVTPASRSVTAPAGSTTFSVGSNTLWTVNESVSWFSVSPMGGTANGTLTVNYNQNISTTPRSGQITVSSTGLPSVVVTVNQAGAGATLSVSPANRNVAPPAGNTTFTISSNTGWTVSESVAWFSVSPMSGTGNGTLNVTYGENSTGSTRIGSITVTASGGSPSHTVTLTQEPYPTHSISLPQGWSGLSSYLMPANNSIEDIFASVSGDFIIAQTMTDIYYPAGPVNTIVNWDKQSAYKIKMNAADILPVIGSEESDKTFDLNAGWNLVPIICNSAVDAQGLFVGQDLGLVKDVAGLGILWPEYNINTIGDFIPGKAYYAMMNAAGFITFPANVKNAEVVNYSQPKMPANPWIENITGSSTHAIAVLSQGFSGVIPGDVIGIFAEDGHCYGISEIQSLTQNLAIAAFADDPYTYNQDGFEDGNLMTLKIYRPSTTEVFDVNATYDYQQANTELFQSEGISVITSLKVSELGMGESLASAISLYPNPTNGVVIISGISDIEKIEIFNAGGEMLRAMATEAAAGLKINLSDLPAGVYQVKFTGQSSTLVKKLIRK